MVLLTYHIHMLIPSHVGFLLWIQLFTGSNYPKKIKFENEITADGHAYLIGGLGWPNWRF